MVTKAATTEMLNALRDEIDNQVSEIAVGTDGSDPTTNDTSLGTEVLSKAVSKTEKRDGEITHIVRILASEANGNDLAEAGDKDGSGNLEDRFAYAPLSKTNDIEVEIRTIKTVRNA